MNTPIYCSGKVRVEGGRGSFDRLWHGMYGMVWYGMRPFYSPTKRPYPIEFKGGWCPFLPVTLFLSTNHYHHHLLRMVMDQKSIQSQIIEPWRGHTDSTSEKRKKTKNKHGSHHRHITMTSSYRYHTTSKAERLAVRLSGLAGVVTLPRGTTVKKKVSIDKMDVSRRIEQKSPLRPRV